MIRKPRIINNSWLSLLSLGVFCGKLNIKDNTWKEKGEIMPAFYYKGHFTLDETFVRFVDKVDNIVCDIPETLFEALKPSASESDMIYIPFLFSGFYFDNKKVEIKNPILKGKYVEIDCCSFYLRYPVDNHCNISVIKKYAFLLDNYIYGELYNRYDIKEKSMTNVDEFGNIHVMIELPDENYRELVLEVIKSHKNKIICNKISNNKISLTLQYANFALFPNYSSHYEFLVDRYNGILIDRENIMYNMPNNKNFHNVPQFTPNKNFIPLTTKNGGNHSAILRSFYDEKTDCFYERIGMLVDNFSDLQIKARQASEYLENLSLIRELSIERQIIPCFDYGNNGEFSFYIHLDYSLLPFDEEIIKEYIKKEFEDNYDENIYLQTLYFTENGVKILGYVV